MPNNPRQQIKKDLDRCINHLDWIGTVLTQTQAKYVEAAPDYVERYRIAIQMTLELQDLISAIKAST